LVFSYNLNRYTLIHRDSHPGNLLFTNETDIPYIIDWQRIGIAKAIRDVSVILVICLKIENRRKYDQELLEYYFSILSEYTIDTYSLEQLRIDYVTSLPIYFILSSMLVSDVAKINDFNEIEGEQIVTVLFKRSMSVISDNFEQVLKTIELLN